MIYHQSHLPLPRVPTKFTTISSGMSSPDSVTALLQVRQMMHQAKGLDLLIARRGDEEKEADDLVTAEPQIQAHEEEVQQQVRPSSSSSSRSQKSRRRIFSEFWDRDDLVAPCGATAPEESKAADERCSFIDICQYSPAPEIDLKTHHELLQNVLIQSATGQIPSSRKLPSLPDPLRRMVSESICSKGCGMYPLVSPTPILRKSRYSSGRRSHGATGSSLRKARTKKMLNTDLLQSVHGLSHNSLKKFGLLVSDQEEKALYQLACERRHKSVGFDPRIVITEFDDSIKREWYLERELATLKSETILLARQYTLLHPKVAQNLNKESFDPVIGKIRKKKGLYSLPVLNTLPEDFDFDMFNRQLDEMLFKGVKRVLIVDPNQVIQHLFCRSLKKIFPDSEFQSADSAEEALRMYTRAMGLKSGSMRAFDIMVVEENLFLRSKARRGGNAKSSTVSLERMQSLGSYADTTPPSRRRKQVKQASLSNLDKYTQRAVPERRGMTGSQLIKRITQLEDQVYSAGKKKQCFRSVIVGVSTNLEKDRDALQESGADFVWSKPPPPMGTNLRNQLLGALISKRQGSND